MDGFTFDERLGLYFTVQSACLSIASVTFLLAYAFVRWLKRMQILRRSSGRVQAEATDSSLFLNLMLADLLQAIGNMPNIKWMREGSVTRGSLCTAQAVMKQIGINGVALTSLAIALHTFSVLILRWRAPHHISKFMVAAVWVSTGLIVGIPNIVHRDVEYYGVTEYWCWIVREYTTARIMSEYFWVWMAALAMVILYGIMFLVMRGFVIIEDGIHWHTSENRVHLDLDGAENEEERETRAIANLLLFYPAVYIICVFPNSLSRWLSFAGRDVPHQFTFFANSLFAFSGMFNVILFLLTRPELVRGPIPEVVEPSTLSPQSPHSHASMGNAKYGHLPMGVELSPVSPTAPSPNEKSPAYDTQIMYRSPQVASKTLPPPSVSYSASSRPHTGNSSKTRDDEDSNEDGWGRLPA